ncbi:hypothetical protein [Microvirga sp. KLBC 81]|nr:hypothetical protein [Microvirga sp. KLBC 81]
MCLIKRDHRHKAGDDVVQVGRQSIGASTVIPTQADLKGRATGMEIQNR